VGRERNDALDEHARQAAFIGVRFPRAETALKVAIRPAIAAG
jgi:hypothetical protein